MSMASKRKLSIALSKRLDECGYSEDRIRERIHIRDKISKAEDIFSKKITNRHDIEKIIVGSKGEGLGLFNRNDTDIMQIDHGVVCRQHHQHFGKTKKTVFIMEQNNDIPGYCMLRYAGDDFNRESYERISYALDERETGHYLSSDKFMSQNDDVYYYGDGYICRNTKFMPRQGPSFPKYVNENKVDKCVLSWAGLSRHKIDFVRAFPCELEEILTEWRKRKRPSGWLSQETIDCVMKQPIHVVPVGLKGSLDEDLQWRICFNLAEIHLLKSFNITQTKVFVNLKLIAKHILRPVSRSITSFVMKNVVLWLAEKTPQGEYREEHLLDRLEDAIMYLKECVDNAELPCYMIPQRNLFTGKLQGDEQYLIRNKLNYLLEYGNIHKEINRITDVYLKANVDDKHYTCSVAMLSTEELTEQYINCFLSFTILEIGFYGAVFHSIPFLLTYGIKGVSKPLSIDLSNQITTELKAQSSMITQDKTEGAYGQPKPYFTLAEIGIVQTPIKCLIVSLVLDMVLYLNIGGFCSLWNSKIFQKLLEFMFILFFFVIVYRETKQANTLIEWKGPIKTALTYFPEKLLHCEYTVKSLSLLVTLNSFGLFNLPLRNTLLTLILIVLGRLSRKVKELIPWQDMLLWVLTFKAPCLDAIRMLPSHRNNIRIKV